MRGWCRAGHQWSALHSAPADRRQVSPAAVYRTVHTVARCALLPMVMTIGHVAFKTQKWTPRLSAPWFLEVLRRSSCKERPEARGKDPGLQDHYFVGAARPASSNLSAPADSASRT